MVKIRLRRVGATKRPMYRIVAADARAPRDGRFLETLGHYNPLTDPATVVVKEDRIQYWIQHGAQPTDVVVRLLRKAGVIASPNGSLPTARTAPSGALPAVEEETKGAEEESQPPAEGEGEASEEESQPTTEETKADAQQTLMGEGR